LYSLPAVAMKVLELTNNPQVDTRALKDCIENDPALTGKILRVVNSSLFGLSRQVSDLNQALALLGTKPLKLLVLGFSLPGGLFAGVAGEVLGRYWRHTLTKAVAGREISETLWNLPGDDAFVSGLLQDLGMLLLIQELGEPYVRFLKKVFAGGQDLAALEIEALGFDHTMLSARLLNHWGLPPTLVEAVAWKYNDRQAAGTPGNEQILPQILHLAELVARLLADQQPGVLGELLSAGRKCRDLSAEQLKALVDHLEEKVRQLADVFKLHLPEGLDYRDILVQAHAQLAAVAAETVESVLRGRQTGLPCLAEESLLGELQGISDAVAKAAGRRKGVGSIESASSQATPAAQHDSGSAAVSAALCGQDARAPRFGIGSHRAHGPAAVAPAVADHGLLDRLAVAVAACRQSRRPLSLLLVKLDRAEELAEVHCQQGFDALRQLVESACRNADHPLTICFPHGNAGFALILPHCERRQAVELGNQLIGQFGRLSRRGQGSRSEGVSLSVGAAAVTLPPKNFPPEDLLSGASRCLYGSHASGGGVVKSIEIY
jgi:HD-like signal output (HDOD) protein/GGDEF domain-containing protein